MKIALLLVASLPLLALMVPETSANMPAIRVPAKAPSRPRTSPVVHKPPTHNTVSNTNKALQRQREQQAQRQREQQRKQREQQAQRQREQQAQRLREQQRKQREQQAQRQREQQVQRQREQQRRQQALKNQQEAAKRRQLQQQQQHKTATKPKQPTKPKTNPVPHKKQPVPPKTNPVPQKKQPVPTKTNPVPHKKQPVLPKTNPVPHKKQPVQPKTKPTPQKDPKVNPKKGGNQNQQPKPPVRKNPTPVKPQTPVQPKVPSPPTNPKIPTTPSKGGQGIVDAASAWKGTPYSFGGGSLDGPAKASQGYGKDIKGFDCSSLARYAVHKATGKTLPRTADQQWHSNQCVHVPFAQRQAGDLVFWKEGAKIGHVGIVADKDNMWHAPHHHEVVKKAPIFGDIHTKSVNMVRMGEVARCS